MKLIGSYGAYSNLPNKAIFSSHMQQGIVKTLTSGSRMILSWNLALFLTLEVNYSNYRRKK